MMWSIGICLLFISHSLHFHLFLLLACLSFYSELSRFSLPTIMRESKKIKCCRLLQHFPTSSVLRHIPTAWGHSGFLSPLLLGILPRRTCSPSRVTATDQCVACLGPSNSGGAYTYSARRKCRYCFPYSSTASALPFTVFRSYASFQPATFTVYP